MIAKAKGTYDLFDNEGRTYNYIEEVIKGLMESFNYDYIKTPVFESSELFHRGVGETTDIVTKETYDFKDRGDRLLTLRPEGTAGVVRSFIENKMYTANMPKKLWYLENMYRYERPQKGRYREFLQFGCEVLGSIDPMLDAEVISIPVALFETLGLKGVKVNVNTLGDEESRKNYKDALLKHFKPHLDELCDDCKARFEKNPLRILDCKVDSDKEVLKNAPRTVDYLNESSREHFEKVLKYLDAAQINYEVNPNVIRGLDYYTHTVFEIEASVEGFGAQNVLCGGGRYNNLVKSLDGPDTPACGFATGLERLMTALEYENVDTNSKKEIDCYLIPIGDMAKEFSFSLNQALRIVGLRSDIDYMNRSMKSNLKHADENGAKFALIIGEDEVKDSFINVRNMKTKEEMKIDNNNILEFLTNNCEEECSNDECDCEECDGTCSCEDHNK